MHQLDMRFDIILVKQKLLALNKANLKSRLSWQECYPREHTILWRHRFFVGFSSRYRLITYGH